MVEFKAPVLLFAFYRTYCSLVIFFIISCLMICWLFLVFYFISIIAFHLESIFKYITLYLTYDVEIFLFLSFLFCAITVIYFTSLYVINLSYIGIIFAINNRVSFKVV